MERSFSSDNVHLCFGPAFECQVQRFKFNRTEKLMCALAKENYCLRNSLKAVVDQSTIIFRELLDRENNGGQQDETTFAAGWGSVGVGYSVNYSSQSTQLVSLQRPRALKPAEEALKYLEAVGRFFANSAGKSEGRAVESSGSETAYESDSGNVSKKRKSKDPAVVDICSDEEASVPSAADKNTKKVSSIRGVATECVNGKKRAKQVGHTDPQVSAKHVKDVSHQKSLNLTQTADDHAEEALMPLDLSQRVMVTRRQVPQQTSFSQPVKVGNKKRVACPKCGKLYLPSNFGRHSAINHSFPCKYAGCKMSFISSKDLKTHQAESMCKHLTKK